MACDEAEVGEEEYAERMLNQQKLQDRVNCFKSKNNNSDNNNSGYKL